MKQSDPLELVDPGSLVRPGIVGRLVRLTLGLLCLYALWEIFRYWAPTTSAPLSTLDNRALMLLAPLCILNYVVNIGFAQSWGYRPLLVSMIILAVAAVGAFALAGTLDSPVLGLPLNLWLAYFYGHLGLSFVLAAVLATPGCEMRAIPETFGRIRGVPSAEHRCPAAFITKIDEWEQRRLKGL